MFRFVFLTVVTLISAVIQHCHGEKDPLVDLRGNETISNVINKTEQSLRQATEGLKKVVCFWNSYAPIRKGIVNFNVEHDFDPFLCTHVIVLFADVDSRQNSLQYYDNENLQSLLRRKQVNPNLKIMLSVGGRGSSPRGFPIIFGNRERRAEFIQNAVNFLNDTSLDGIDLDWRYTAKRTRADRENYVSALKEFREEFEKIANRTGLPRYLLSISLPILEDQIDEGFDLPAISLYVDFMTVYTFLYHNWFEPRTAHHAPIYHRPEENEYQYARKLTVNHTVSYLIEKGADARKLILVVPTVGITYALTNSSITGPGAPAGGSGKNSVATTSQGGLAYYEICRNITDGGWTVVDNEKNTTAPYAYKGSVWISYDNMKSARLKAKFANEKGLGGLAIVVTEWDDFNGTCHNKTYFPILNAAKEEFLFGESVTMRSTLPANGNITFHPACPLPSQNATRRAANSTVHLADRETKMLACYFNLEALERIGIDRFTGEDLDPFLCTHVIVSATLTPGLNSISLTYIAARHLESLQTRKQYNPHLKIILAVFEQSLIETSGSFSEIFNDRIKRQEFTRNVVKFLSDFSLDGVEIDWLHSVLRTAADRENYALALKEFREEFDKIAKRTMLPRYLLSTVLPHFEPKIDRDYDLPAISSYVDFMTVRAFRFHDGYKQVNHIAPIYYQQEENEYQYDKKLTVNHTISYLIKNGADARKLVLGIPIIGKTYTLTNFSNTGLGALASGPGEASGITRKAGDSGYGEICRNINDGGWTVVNAKPNSMGPYAYSGYDWVSYDNMDSARLKAKFANENGLGGLAFYYIDLDDFKGACHNEVRFPIVKAAKGEFLFGESAMMRPILPAAGDLSTLRACSLRSQNANESRAVNSTTNLANDVTLPPPTTTLHPVTRSELGLVPPNEPMNKQSDLNNVDNGKGSGGQQNPSDTRTIASKKNEAKQKTRSRGGNNFFFGPNTINIYNYD